MSKEPLTHSDRYVRKTNRIILIVGIISLCVFFFGLLLLGADEGVAPQHYEIEKSIDAESDVGLNNNINNEAEIVFDDVAEEERPITMTPNPINMGQIVIGNEATNVLTIGTNGKRAIHIISVDLEDAPFDGFSYETDCNDKELRGKLTCNVVMKWTPPNAMNVQNNFKVIWHETNVTDSNAKHDEVPVYGNAIIKEECSYCDSGVVSGVETSNLSAEGKRFAIGPDGKVIGVISEDGLVRDFNGNVIGRVRQSDGMIVDKDGNIIGVASGGKLILDDNGNVIGYVDENGIAHDVDGNVIGRMLADGTVVDNNGNILGKAVDYGYVYDDEGNIIGRVLSDGTVIDNNGNVIGRVDENGNVVDFNGNVIGHVAKSGEVVTDSEGNHLGVVMPNGEVVDENGDVVGRLNDDGSVTTTQLIGKRGATARMAVDENGNIIGYIDENGNVVDFNGNVIGRVDKDGNVVDKNGRIIGKVSDEWRDLALDENGKVIGYIDKDGLVRANNGEIIGYVDENGNIIGNLDNANATVIGSAGQKVSLAYDQDGKVIGYVDENGNVYDMNGNIIGKVDENGNIVDENGKIIGRRGEEVNLAFDKDGKVIGYIDKNGVVRDWNNKIVGISDVSGNVRSFGSKIIGGLVNKNMLPITPAGKILGKINNRGEVVVDKKIVGKMRPNGLVTDVAGTKILAKGVNAGIIARWGCDYSYRLDADGVVRHDGEDTEYRLYADGTVWTTDEKFVGKVISSGSVFDNECNYVGEASADGYVRDVNRKEIGCVNPDGTVLDLEEPRLLGHIVQPKAVISSETWQSIGVLDINGTLRDTEGNPVGCSNIYGDVYDRNMAYLGTTANVKYAYDFTGKYLGSFDVTGNISITGINGAHLIFDNLIADKNLNIVGYALPEIAVFVDAEGKKIGHLFPDGMIYDAQGNAVDKFNGGEVGYYAGVAAKLVLPQQMVDADGLLMGQINYDLQVVDYKGEIKGSVNPKGQMFGDLGRQVGGVVKQGGVRGYNGIYLGYVTKTGAVVELEDLVDGSGKKYAIGEITGSVTPDEHVIKDKQIIGEVLPQDVMVDVFGNIVGISNSKGQVISADNKVIATLLPGGGNNNNYADLKRGMVIDFNGNIIGIALPTGEFMDVKHVIVGRVLADGKVISTDGNILGEVVSGDIVIGNDDEVKGIISFDGKVYQNGRLVGRILTDGLAVDKQNNILGRTYNIGNTVLSNFGDYIGRLTANGKVVVNNNREVGYLKSNGSFVDIDKNVSGYSLPEVARNRRN